MQIGIMGWNSRIAVEFRRIIRSAEYYRIDWQNVPAGVQTTATHYLMCSGVLFPIPRNEQSGEHRRWSFYGNCQDSVNACEKILSENSMAKICVIGSESAYRGSYDESYAQNKALLHEYVQTKNTGEHQQLFCISPSIIEDAGMTLRREDQYLLDTRREEHPKKRFLTAREVAMMAAHILFEQPYVTGTIIRMHGSNE